MVSTKFELILEKIRSLNVDEFNNYLTDENTVDDFYMELKYLVSVVTEQRRRQIFMIEHVTECISGDFFNQIPISEKNDELDVLCMGFNTYIEELRDATVSKEALEKTNAELNIAIEKADELSKSKDLFMSNMSHEIRTPLNGILGFTNLLIAEPNITPPQKEQLGIILQSSGILMDIVNNILELNNINAGNIKLDENEINLYHVISTCLDQYSGIIHDKKITIQNSFDSHVPTKLLGDNSKLSQIFNNLISNAVKHTPNEGTIIVESKLREVRDKNYEILFSISDTGMGISEQNLENIFDPFYQENKSDISKSGAGLGLTIVKKTVDFLQGTIDVQTEINKGTTFTVSLPFSRLMDDQKKEDRMNNENKVMANYKNIQILVAEDNAINQLLIKTILEKEGFDVDLVENGLLAVEAFKLKDYHIVLMDLMMPEMNGYESSIKIREICTETNKYIPIVAVSADVTSEVRENCTAAGMDDYISKPYEASYLVEKIFQYVDKN